ncbi:MAG TPA: universal stress protein [Thermodesulfobacteriota bacterium]
MTILHPTDFSSCAGQAQARAAALARAFGAEVLLVYVLVEAMLFGEGFVGMAEVERIYDAQKRWAEKALADRVAELEAQGIKARSLLVVGVPADEIVRAAERERADLIVLGTHGRGAVGRFFLGSIADRVVRTAPCPVVTVREGADATR